MRLRVYDDAYTRLEKLFMVFGAILLAAVVLSVAVFCFSLCVSWSTCITHVHACTHTQHAHTHTQTHTHT